MSRRKLIPLLLLLCLAGATAGPVLAEDKKTTLEQATRIVKERDEGRVLSAKTKKEGGQEVHQVKILDDKGHVKTVKVPAKDK